MKRSEVIKLINNQIEGYMNPSSSMHIAEKILRTVEEIGMLPPDYTIDCGYETPNVTVKGYTIYKNQWESEDEEKSDAW